MKKFKMTGGMAMSLFILFVIFVFVALKIFIDNYIKT